MRRHVLSIRPRCGAFIAAGESHARFLTNLMQVHWIGWDRDIHSPVKNLSFLKMIPCLNTGVQYERI